jgi:hypothetical protein
MCSKRYLFRLLATLCYHVDLSVVACSFVTCIYLVQLDTACVLHLSYTREHAAKLEPLCLPCMESQSLICYITSASRSRRFAAFAREGSLIGWGAVEGTQKLLWQFTPLRDNTGEDWRMESLKRNQYMVEELFPFGARIYSSTRKVTLTFEASKMIPHVPFEYSCEGYRSR